MTSQSQGIQQLLQAEKRAKDKLEEAKKRKGKRLKQAKEEAIAEIDHYRLQREKNFRQKQSNIMGSQGNLSTKIDEETTTKIRDLTNHYCKNMESMMGLLLDKVYNISPEIHPNYAYTI
ncbi:V-type proton ATPase subunit G 3 [Sphaerodactylus townsendi]|uniref:V-type proton ATPase subunit G 3 n=1 Tax=Sphaerodactylus townsendi TaxID=933632 RepID=UPI0020270C22|nr:V-type proton ATPase subunit G 3 [Sphaerodactylus townsendi]